MITMDGSLAETGCLEEEEEVLEGQDLEVEEALHEGMIVGEVMITEEVEAVVEEAAGPVVVVLEECPVKAASVIEEGKK